MATDTYDYTQDQDFLKAPPEKQHSYLMSVDQDYAKAKPEDQQKYRAHISQHIPTETEAGVVPPTAPMPQKPNTLRRSNVIEPEILASPVAPAGAAASIPRAIGGLAGGYGGAKIAQQFTSNPWVRDLSALAGGVLGEGGGLAAEETASRVGFTPKGELSTPIGKFTYRREQPSLGGGAPEPSRGEFEAQREAQLTSEGKFNKLPSKVPKQEVPLPVKARAEMEKEFASREAKQPETIAKKGLAVGKAKSQLVHGRPFEQLNEQEQAEALMRRGREQQQIEEGAPVEGSSQKPLTVPEPGPVQPGDKPGAQWSVKRRSDLIQNAKRGREGAGTVLNQINKPILYEPRGVVGTSPREVTTFGEGGKPIVPVKGGAEGTVGRGPIGATSAPEAPLPHIDDLEEAFRKKGATGADAYRLAKETLDEASGATTVPDENRQLALERIARIMGPERRGPNRLGPEYRGIK